MRLNKVVYSVAVASVLAVLVGTSSSLSANALPVAPHAISASKAISPDWINSATVYEVNTRQFSQEGNFAGVTAALPRLKALGTDVLWLMPIFPISTTGAKGSLGSPYAVSDYQAVNPNYGTDADFKQLVDSAHALGMKIVLDWVPNHTGWDNAWIKQHPDWYTHDAQGNITWPAGTDWTDVADLNYDNQGLRTAMTDALKYWVTKFDIDGYRQDVAGGVPTDFWDTATAQVNAIKQLWWLAENQDQTDLLYKSFSANYNWQLLGALNKVGSRDDALYAISNAVMNYPAGTYPMNFITNHDENSWNGTEFQRLGNAVKESAVISFTVPGIPLIYNGQEIGMNRQLQFFEKDPIDWKPTSTSAEWTAFYTKLTKLRKLNPALWAGLAGGSTDFFTSSQAKVLSYGRTKAKNKVIVLSNLSQKAVSAKLSFGKYAGTYYDYATGKKMTVAKSASVKIPAWGYVVYSTIAVK
jgi:glycosidase